jgi:hypothetical protein
MIYTDKMEMLLNYGIYSGRTINSVDDGDTRFGDAQIKVWYTPG